MTNKIIVNSDDLAKIELTIAEALDVLHQIRGETYYEKEGD